MRKKQEQKEIRLIAAQIIKGPEKRLSDAEAERLIRQRVKRAKSLVYTLKNRSVCRQTPTAFENEGLFLTQLRCIRS